MSGRACAGTMPILPSRSADVGTFLLDTALATWGILACHAWFEVYLGGRWHTFDPRNNVPRVGRVLMARGRDATDVAIATTLGPSSVRTTADIYSHAIRGKDHAAAQCWDDIMQRSRSETDKSKTVN
jgi:hypothetical protein